MLDIFFRFFLHQCSYLFFFKNFDKRNSSVNFTALKFLRNANSPTKYALRVKKTLSNIANQCNLTSCTPYLEGIFLTNSSVSTMKVERFGIYFS